MHFVARIALCLLMGLPTLASAQTTGAPVDPAQVTPPPLITVPPEGSPAPSESEPPPPRGEIIPQQRHPDTSRLLVPRILAGSTLGSLAGAGGGVVGFIGGLLLADCDLEGCSGDSDFLISVPMVLGVGLASSLTVYGLGEAMDGNGYLVGAMLGGILGASAGVAAAFSNGGSTWILLTPALSAAGAVIAYEISSIDREPEPAQDPDPYLNLRLAPVFSVTPKGGVLGGLMGQF